MDYIWRKLRSESVLRTPHYGVSRDLLRHPHGHDVDYYVIDHPRQAAGVVAPDAAGRILLVQQWRHPVQKLMWSLPAGGIEVGESPEAAARRELHEETGHVASAFQKLVEFHPNPGTANQVFHLFRARDVQPSGGRQPGEIHDVRWFEPADVDRMLATGELSDGLTLVGLLTYFRQGS